MYVNSVGITFLENEQFGWKNIDLKIHLEPELGGI